MKNSFIQPTFVRPIALTQEHGSWVFLLSPLLIGLFAGGRWTAATPLLILAALAAFLVRQPVTIGVKVLTRRRPLSELPVARFWILVYALVGLGALLGLIAQGFAYLLYLVLPAIPVFGWHLFLVSRRRERRQAGVEVVASGVLALAAPAGFWVGRGYPDVQGWWLFVLTWMQSAASIVYAYLRLEQRTLNETPVLKTRFSMARRALLYTTFNLVVVGVCTIVDLLPSWLTLPYGLQWAETLWGTLKPAVGMKPTAIGLRQLVVSSLFTILFILTWNL